MCVGRQSMSQLSNESKERELFEYIKNNKYYCCFCHDLQQKVIKEGVGVIGEYKGMICGAVADMMDRYQEVKNI